MIVDGEPSNDEELGQLIWDLSPAGVGGSLGDWLALEDEFPDYLALEDSDGWLLLEGWSPDVSLSDASVEYTQGEPIVAAALETIAKDQLVGIVNGGAVLADAVKGIPAVGVADNSAFAGASITIKQGGYAGPFTVPFAAGSALYLGMFGQFATATPAGAKLTQMVGTADDTGAVTEIKQAVYL